MRPETIAWIVIVVPGDIDVNISLEPEPKNC